MFESGSASRHLRFSSVGRPDSGYFRDPKKRTELPEKRKTQSTWKPRTPEPRLSPRTLAPDTMFAVSQFARLAPRSSTSKRPRAPRRSHGARVVVRYSESDDTSRLLSRPRRRLRRAQRHHRGASPFPPRGGEGDRLRIQTARRLRRASPSSTPGHPRQSPIRQKSLFRKNQQRVFELSYARFRAFLCPRPLTPRPPILLPFSA